MSRKDTFATVAGTTLVSVQFALDIVGIFDDSQTLVSGLMGVRDAMSLVMLIQLIVIVAGVLCIIWGTRELWGPPAARLLHQYATPSPTPATTVIHNNYGTVNTGPVYISTPSYPHQHVSPVPQPLLKKVDDPIPPHILNKFAMSHN